MVDPGAGKSVVVGIDGSETALGAVRWAVGEAALRRLPLRIVSATPVFDPKTIYTGVPPQYFYDLADAARADLAVALDAAKSHAKDSDAEVDIATKLLAGDPVPDLVRASESAQLFVLGLHGEHHTGLSSVGSLTWTLVGKSVSPVAVVSDRAPERPQHRIVAVGVDSSDYSRRALDLAFAEASLRGADLRVVHAWTWRDLDSVLDPLNTVPFERPAGESIALSEMLAGYREEFPDVSVQQRLIEARPHAALVAAAEHADVLVVGSRGRGGFASAVLGSTSRRMLGTIDCPLLVAR